MSWQWRLLGTVFLVGPLTACLDSQASAKPETMLYRHDFGEGSGGWETAQTLLEPDEVPENPIDCWTSWLGMLACTHPAPVAAGSMALKSPWWLDNNHAPPGAGYLSLLTWLYLGGINDAPTENLKELDLRDAILRVALRVEDLDLKGGQLVFWFQTLMDDGRYANFAYTGEPLNLLLHRRDARNRIEVTLDPDEARWTCLGTSQSRGDTYGCMPLADAMGKVNTDFGFIIFPVDGSPLVEAQPSGAVYIDSVEILRR